MPFSFGRLVKIEYGVVAQLVEHLTFNQVVGSSSLLSLSNGKHVSIGLRAFLFYNKIKDIVDFYIAYIDKFTWVYIWT